MSGDGPDLSRSDAADASTTTAPQHRRPVLPLLLILDTSSSMAAVTGELRAAATAALDAAWGNALGPRAAALGVLTAGGTASVLVAMGPPTAPGDLPPLRADGRADIDGAITLVGEQYERLQVAHLEAGRRLLRPWVLMVTDGRWERGDAANAIDRLHAPPTRPVVCPVGVGDVDETTLARIATDVGYAVDTPGDLPSVVHDLIVDVLRLGSLPEADGELRAPAAPAGSRPLEGW